MDSRDRKVPVMQLLIQDQTHVLACLYGVAELLPKDYFQIEDSMEQLLNALAERKYSIYSSFLKIVPYVLFLFHLRARLTHLFKLAARVL